MFCAIHLVYRHFHTCSRKITLVCKKNKDLQHIGLGAAQPLPATLVKVRGFCSKIYHNQSYQIFLKSVLTYCAPPSHTVMADGGSLCGHTNAVKFGHKYVTFACEWNTRKYEKNRGKRMREPASVFL